MLLLFLVLQCNWKLHSNDPWHNKMFFLLNYSDKKCFFTIEMNGDVMRSLFVTSLWAGAVPKASNNHIYVGFTVLHSVVHGSRV